MAGFGEQKASHKKKIKLEGSKQIHGESLLRRAISHHTQGDLINAEKKYREALQIGYHHHSIFTNLGVIYKISGRAEEAISL